MDKHWEGFGANCVVKFVRGNCRGRLLLCRKMLEEIRHCGVKLSGKVFEVIDTSRLVNFKVD